MLQCVVVCCSVLQCVAVCCDVLQCVAVCCSALQCVATYFCVAKTKCVRECRWLSWGRSSTYRCNVWTLTPTHARTLLHIYICINTYTYTQIHTYTYIHTPKPTLNKTQTHTLQHQTNFAAATQNMTPCTRIHILIHTQTCDYSHPRTDIRHI